MIKTILFWIFGILLCLLLLFIFVLAISAACVDPGKEYEQNSRFYRFLLNSATAFCIPLLRIRVHATGLDRLPRDGRFLLVENHRSKFDPILTWYIFKDRDIAFISKPENFQVPCFGRIIRKCCFMAIDREDPRNAMQTIQKASELIRRDVVSVGVYPEGTRSKTCELLPFHNGVFKIAQKADVPIVVAAVEGTERIHKNCPWRPSEVSLKIVDVIPREFVREHRTTVIGERIRLSLEKTLTER